MSMVKQEPEDDITTSEETKVAVMAPGAAYALNKSEVEAQLDAAHKYGRSIRSFLNEAITLATFDKEVAMSCIYALPRSGKVISGPSVRLAEICASAYGNLHMGARVVGIEDKEIVAQGICWDLEKNNRVTIEVRRRITGKSGARYNEDMITVTGNAAASIGLRNAIFRIIPKAYVNAVYQKAREVSVGTAFTLSETRGKVIERLTKTGVTLDRILTKAQRPSVEDISLDDVELLIGLGTAIKNGDISIDDAFPKAENLPPANGKSAIDRIVEQKQKSQDSGSAVKAAGDAASPAAPSGAATEAPRPDASPTAEPCDSSDFDRLEILGSDCKVLPKKWKKHIEETMNFSAWDLLTKDRLPEVQKWIEAQKRA